MFVVGLAEHSSNSNSLLTEFFDSGAERTHDFSTITDTTFNHGCTDDFGLGEWFKRPVKIAVYNWSEGTTLDQTINPWYTYFSNAEIYDKIKGFSRLQATLHVKLTINASPYQYSMGIMSYTPLDNGQLDRFSGGQVRTLFTTGDSGLSVSTTRPHTFFYPQFSRGCEMVLPFVYYKNWINLDTNLTELNNMGRLRIQSIGNLQTTSTAATQPIVVTLYAWCEYHKATGPSYSLQSGDEYAERPVSTIASVVSKIAKTLYVFPYLKPYAMATSMIATSVGDVARFFGFSNPPVITDVHAYRPNYMPQFASPEISVQLDKLSLDPKNEVCVDSRTVGLNGKDEMDIATICDRDVVINTVAWQATDVVTTPLCVIHVGPQVSFATSATGSVTTKPISYVQMTPSAHIGCAFDMWTGSITYRFTSVASQFHRGRLLVSFDPDGFKNTYTAASYTGPRTISKVWDIEKNSDFEFEVPYLAPTAFLKTGGLVNQMTDRGEMIFDRPTLPGTFYYEDALYNGSIIISVLNALTSNNPDANITLVIRYNCKLVEFAVPKELDIPISVYELQSSDEHVLAAEPDEIVHSGVSVQKDNGYCIYTGEVVRSIRQLLHRTNLVLSKPAYTISQTPKTVYSDTVPALNGNVAKAFGQWSGSFVLPHVPLYSGRLPLDAVTGLAKDVNVGPTGSVLWNSTIKPTPITPFFSSCYVGWRGSSVYKAKIACPDTFLFGTTGSDKTYGVRVLRFGISRFMRGIGNIFSAGLLENFFTWQANARSANSGITDNNIGFWYLSNLFQRSGLYPLSGNGGITATNAEKVNVTDAVIPYYSNMRMFPGGPLGAARAMYSPNSLTWNAFDKTTDDVWIANPAINVTISTDIDITNTASIAAFVPQVDVYHAAGVDFTCFMYLNPPTICAYSDNIDGYLSTYA